MTAPIYQLPIPDFIAGIHAPMRRTFTDPHRFKSICWHRRGRKTTRGLNKLISEAALHEKEVYAYIAPTYQQAKKIVVRDPNMLQKYLPSWALTKPFNESELYAEFRVTKSILHILGADHPDRLRGPKFKGVVLDEWALMKPQILSEILMPVLRESGGWCDLQFTPKGRNHAHAYHLRQGSESFPDWQSYTMRASESGLIPQTELDAARRDMGEALYRQEFECEFLEGAQAVFQGWRACVSGECMPPIDGRRYVAGIDLGRAHDATVILVMDCVTRHVVFYQRLLETHWALQREQIIAMDRRYHPLSFVDCTGLGSPIEEDLRDAGCSVEGVNISGNKIKRDLIDRLRTAIAQRLITFPDLIQLCEELEEFEIKVHAEGAHTDTVRYGCPDGEGYYDDSVMALALAVAALRSDLYTRQVAPERAADRYAIALDEIPVNYGITYR